MKRKKENVLFVGKYDYPCRKFKRTYKNNQNLKEFSKIAQEKGSINIVRSISMQILRKYNQKDTLYISIK